MGEFYSPPNERALRYDDPRLGLTWPLPVTVMSDKDEVAPLTRDVERPAEDTEMTI